MSHYSRLAKGVADAVAKSTLASSFTQSWEGGMPPPQLLDRLFLFLFFFRKAKFY